ncbi:HGxxPAAW family protein [Kineococcus gypseus]|uniref:HGxxPAAW family protein n=1 Tax=Kineococcus gypseus TaxID=1637102 RepID=UPI003D7DC0D1
MTSQQPQPRNDDVVEEHGHGHTVAAWAGVGTALVGFLVLSLAVVFTSLVWGIVGGVVILASMAVGWGLSRAGYGVKTTSGHPVGVGRPRH